MSVFNLIIAVKHCVCVTTYYRNDEVGLVQIMVLSGHVDEREKMTSGAPNVGCIAASLEFTAPPNAKWLAHVDKDTGTSSAFGLVAVNKGLEPEAIEISERIIPEPPVRVFIQVSREAFEAIRRQAADAEAQRRVLWALVSLDGASLPKTSNLSVKGLGGLDVSEPRRYAVTGFGISDSLEQPYLRGGSFFGEVADSGTVSKVQ